LEKREDVLDSATVAGRSEVEMVAQEMHRLAEEVRSLQERVRDVEKVNARLEVAALTTARSLQEISAHWNALYEAMRRVETTEEEREAAELEGRMQRAQRGTEHDR